MPTNYNDTPAIINAWATGVHDVLYYYVIIIISHQNACSAYYIKVSSVRSVDRGGRPDQCGQDPT